MTQIAAREQLDAEQQTVWKTTLIQDDRRRRPLYFDGRFLTARDLVREQDYFLTRQTDLGRAGGAGIIDGLHVRLAEDDSHVQISIGHGVTSQGEVCVIAEPFMLDLTDAPAIQRLDAQFGLLEIPREPSRNLTGLYVLALRPVEFSATPIAAYPTSVNGTRKQHDGEIIEGVVATLIAHSTVGASSEQHLQRSSVAREIFVDGKGIVAPPGTLPLAMIALEQNRVLWIDSFLVRRELGAERGDLLGLGISSRAAKEASIQQYNQQLDELVTEQTGPITASTFFAALPPVGRMPTASVSADFTQVYFPQEMEVDLTLIPADEVPQLIEEALSLPPIDLTLNAEQLQSTSVAVFVPVSRESFRSQAARLQSIQRTLKAAAPGLVAKRSPLEQLMTLKTPKSFTNGEGTPTLSTSADALQAAAWKELLSSVRTLWYARRHNVPWEVSVVTLAPNGGNGNQPNPDEPGPGGPITGPTDGPNPDPDDGPDQPEPEPDGPLPQRVIVEVPAGTPANEAMFLVFEHFEPVSPGLMEEAKTLIAASRDAGGRLTEGAAELLANVLGSRRFVAAPALVLEAYFLLRSTAEELERIDKSAMEEFLSNHRYTIPTIGTGLRLMQRTAEDFLRPAVHLMLGEAAAATIADQNASAIAAESNEKLFIYGKQILRQTLEAEAAIRSGENKKKVFDVLKEKVNAI